MSPTPGEASRGWLLLTAINLLAGAGPRVIEALASQALPSTLVKCLYLFFDLPVINNNMQQQPDNKQQNEDLAQQRQEHQQRQQASDEYVLNIQLFFSVAFKLVSSAIRNKNESLFSTEKYRPNNCTVLPLTTCSSFLFVLPYTQTCIAHFGFVKRVIISD